MHVGVPTSILSIEAPNESTIRAEDSVMEIDQTHKSKVTNSLLDRLKLRVANDTNSYISESDGGVNLAHKIQVEG